MTVLRRFRHAFERLLEAIVILLMAALAVLVVVGVTYRKLGLSLIWYDEVASVMLAWLTYYGAALAALRGAHIGFPGLIAVLKPAWRMPLVIVSEACVFGFFILLAWLGWEVLVILEGDRLVSVNVPLQLTQSVIPIGAVLFIIAEALRLPELWRRVMHEHFVEPELEAVQAAAVDPAAPAGKVTP